MIRSAFTLSFFIFFGVTQAQYHITYREFREDARPLADQTSVSHYYIKDGAYINEHPFGNGWLQSYDATSGQVGWVGIDGSIEYRKMEEYPAVDIKFKSLDTTATILGYTCRGIEIIRGNQKSVFMVADELKVDPESFKAHTMMSWNKVISYSGGSLPLAYTFENNGEIKRTIAVAVEKDVRWTDDLEKFKKKRIRSFSDTYEKWESKFEEKYREQLDAQQTSFHAEGNMRANSMRLPVTVDYKEPGYMKVVFDIMGAKIVIGNNDQYSWVHNGIDGSTVKNPVKQGSSGDGVNELVRMVAFPEITSIRSLDEISGKIYISYFEKNMFRRIRIDTAMLLTDYIENANVILNLSDYNFKNGFLLPTRWKIWSADQPQMEFMLDKIKKQEVFDEGHFYMPDTVNASVSAPVPEEADADFFQQAEVLLEKEKYEEAIPLYRKVLEANPKHYVAFNQLGYCMMQTGDNYGAIANFTRATEIRSDYAVSWANLGYVKADIGDHASAIDSYSKAILHDPNAGYLSLRGQSLYQIDSIAGAIHDFRRAVNTDDKRSVDFFNLGICYRELQQNDSAIYFLDQALALEKVSDIYNERGLANFQAENYEEALDDFQRAYKLEKDLVVLENIGDAYVELNQHEEAIDTYLKILKEDSSRHDIHYYIGNQYSTVDDYPNAIYHYNQAIRLYNDEASYFDARGKAFFSSMKFVEAAEDFSRSLVLYPDDPEIYFLRGISKVNLSDKFDGCKDFKKAMDLGYDPASGQFDEHCSFLDN
ncbi:MAG: tetratricopeptide repeat protein [Cyclobacteriaceae bacterium]